MAPSIQRVLIASVRSTEVVVLDVSYVYFTVGVSSEKAMAPRSP